MTYNGHPPERRERSRKFDQLLDLFDGTPAEATLRDMEAEIGPVRSWDLVHLVLEKLQTVALVIAQLEE